VATQETKGGHTKGEFSDQKKGGAKVHAVDTVAAFRETWGGRWGEKGVPFPGGEAIRGKQSKRRRIRPPANATPVVGKEERYSSARGKRGTT